MEPSNINISINEANTNEISIDKIPTDLANKNEDPKQPKLPFYPVTKSQEKGAHSRSFNYDWFSQYPTLEYSVLLDAVFCFCCRHFTQSSNAEDCFTKNGFKNWKKFHERFRAHIDSISHKNSFSNWINYKQSKSQKGNIVEQMNSQYKQEKTNNKIYLSKLLDLLRYLAKQGLAFRSHNEDIESINRGNFLELCILFSKYDEIFNKKFKETFNYCSPESQNLFIKIMASKVLLKISNRILNVGFYTLLCDEAKSHRTEQLAICIRYVIDLNPVETFIGFYDCSNLRKAQELFLIIKTELENIGIFNIPIIAQSYDGASVMSGDLNGVQSLVAKVHPQAIYIHCMSHRLNLSLVSACKANKICQRFFTFLDSLYWFFLIYHQYTRHIRIFAKI